jgi:lincosamide nucleotidyltransferase A/C/D/E
VRFEEVTNVLDALADAGVRSWVGGGWGVAVLVGRQTRQHRDLDLAIDADQLQTCLDTLRRLGYVTETDDLPVRIELAATGRGWVDVHPVTFDAEGHGRQAAHDGQFPYPPEAFTSGELHGRRIQCLSVVQQQAFHSGYELQAKDHHDLAQLRDLESP